MTAAAQDAGWDVTPAGRADLEPLAGSHFDLVINANGNASRFRAEQDPLFDFEASFVSVYRSLFDFRYDRYVYLSTVDVYNHPEQRQSTSEETQIDPLSLGAYGFHKHQAELAVMRTCPRSLVLRLGQMVGKGLKKGPIYDITNNQPLWIDPGSCLPFMNITSVGHVLFQLLEKSTDGEIFNVCGRTSIEFSRVLELFAACSPQPAGSGAAVQQYEVATEKVEQICQLPDSWDEIESFAREVLGG
jgi:nucleoside-diphosphate-sugar epimerase